jgi:hypothetical protein
MRCQCGVRGHLPSAVLRGPGEEIAVVPGVVTLPFEEPRAGAPEHAWPFAFELTFDPLTPPPRA